MRDCDSEIISEIDAFYPQNSGLNLALLYSLPWVVFVLPRMNRKRLGLLYRPLPPEVFVADDGQFSFPVSGVGVALAYLLLGGVACYGVCGSRFYIS